MKEKALQWKCANFCGACCRLAPLERAEALEALDPDQEKKYMSMVGPDGWCIHYDTGARNCKIYDERPEFCKISSLTKLFCKKESESNTFAIDCCHQQIRSIYGGKSLEMKRFDKGVRYASRQNQNKSKQGVN